MVTEGKPCAVAAEASIFRLPEVGLSSFHAPCGVNETHSEPRTATARNSAPMSARFIKPFDCVSVGELINRKNVVGISFSVDLTDGPQLPLSVTRSQSASNALENVSD